VGGGAHATHLVTPESLCCRVPSNVDLVSAGAIPEAFITAHDALAQRAHLRPRERVLIHGVGSGVGTAAIQVASVMGARTVGTSRTSNKLDRAIELGLDEAIEASGDLADKIGQVDVVLDLIGGEYLDLNVRVTKPRGRILIVGLIAGGSALLDMGAVLSKRLVIEGTILRSRPNYEKALATRAFEREILPLVANGRIRPVVHARFQLDQIGEAYDLLNSNETFGKVLIVPG
jgi:NADPH2:quinone reductase